MLIETTIKLKQIKDELASNNKIAKFGRYLLEKGVIKNVRTLYMLFDNAFLFGIKRKPKTLENYEKIIDAYNDWVYEISAPPKDRCFLADIGLPYLVMCRFNEAQNDYAIADLQADLYETKWNMFYFQSEYVSENEIKSWVEVPKCV